jgi:hypothetical protein
MTRVDPVLKRFLEGYAATHGTTSAKLTREVLAEWMYERVAYTPLKKVDYTLHRLDVLSKQLQLKVAVLPAGENGGSSKVQVAGELTIPGEGKTPTPHPKPEQRPRVDTVKEREELYWQVVAMLHEATKLSENQALAQKAGSRMDAMMVAGTLARIGEAILEGYDRAYIQPHLDELTDLIEQLNDQLRQTDQKGQENATGSTET